MNNFISQVKVRNAYTKYSLKRSNFYLIRWEPKCSTDIHNGKKCDFILLNGKSYKLDMINIIWVDYIV